MKSILKEVNTKKSITFPLLVKNKTNDEVVLFSNYRSGTVIKKALHTTDRLGIYYEDFIDCTEEYAWTILPIGTQIIKKMTGKPSGLPLSSTYT